MDLAEQLDREQWSAIMKRFFAILTEGVERFEGYVDEAEEMYRSVGAPDPAERLARELAASS